MMNLAISGRKKGFRPSKIFEATITGLRISAVDGTAFIDNAAALTPYADGAKYIEIIDSAGANLTGWLEAVGTGETLGSELITNGDFDTDLSGWTVSNPGGSFGWIWDSGRAILSSVAVTKNRTLSQSVLQVLGLHATSFTTTGGDLLVFPGIGFSNEYTFSNGTFTLVVTATNVNAQFFSLIENTTLDSASIKQILTPSTSGATIVSAKNGSTNNFASVEAGFAFNAASYDVVVRR